MKINGTQITASIVAGAAFLASAQHIFSVAYEAGNPWAIAWIHAIGIDGLILIGINALGKARAAAVVSIVYGATVSLIFNAASYGAFKMPPLALAVTMPAALVLAYITQHASQRPKDTGQDKATETAVDVSVRRRTVPAGVPAGVPAPRPVPATVVPPATVPTVVQPTEVVQPERPALMDRPAGRRAPLWTTSDEAKIRAMIESGSHSDRAIAREVFGEDATDATRKRIERFRRNLTGTN